MNIEQNLRHYIQGENFIRGIQPLERYASFDYCFNYFQSFKEQNGIKELASSTHMQESCLQVGFYLASWGMLRASSFLAGKSVKVFETLIREIARADAILWETDADSYSMSAIEAILEFRQTTIRALDYRYGPSDILVTKIMLGVFGNVPAFDTCFRRGFGVNTFGKRALEKIADFYEKNKAIIEKNRVRTLDFATGQPTGRLYTRAKVIDMIFFIEGINQGVSTEITNEEPAIDVIIEGAKNNTMTGKYTPLEHYLRDLSANQQEVTLPFEHIEKILNDKLPRSAYQYQAWWANQRTGSHVEAHAWMDAGWKVEAVNFSEKWVWFVRLSSKATN